MKQESSLELVYSGLWKNNIVLTQLLALCPLLAVTNSATNGVGLGLASTAVMLMSNILASCAKRWVSRAIRIPINILIIATLVTLTDVFMHAYLAQLHQVLGLFIPLIVTNCAILGRVESFASRHSVFKSAVDGLAMGVGFTWVLVVLGGIREILGSGTLFENAPLLLGSHFAFLEVTVIEQYQGVLVAILPPGGFLVLGGMLAAKQKLELYLQSRDKVQKGVIYES
ncbi:electron transport complex subunit E [Vibrio hippocampi]|uniref:Ion-translocating oxidoreductase complex subunit E n=1 Tax=Vibrio hippocampi TaxID=654686 RepID=A0ABN8DN79_9VIBR|nr:electron transport complex subunit E [Vibrio hippocampi]CAH0529349.1 Ion-translocating oxidoreductase complex subunit E [Vibrio hippocampi]